MPPIEIIVNAGSGSVECETIKQQLVEAFEQNGASARVHLAKGGADIFKFTDEAVKGDAQTIVAGGGDGTISAVASKIIETDKVLGVLPLGTLNNFSKDLQIPQDLEEAVRIIAENLVKEVDAAEVNGRVFINNSSIGLYPQIVKNREETQERLGHGKWWAAFWAALKILKRSPFLQVKLKTEQGERTIKTPFVFVGNGAYAMDFFNIGRRERLDDGKLSVYFLHKSGRRGLLSLVLRTVFGRLRQANDFEEISVEEITIETRRKKILVAFDGEVDTLDTPLCYRVRPKALRLTAPE